MDANVTTAIGTVILAIITAVYVILTHRILKEQVRPLISVHFHVKDRMLDLHVKNIGSRPARNINIEFSPSLKEIENDQPDLESDFSFYNHLLSQNFLGVGEEKAGLINLTPQILAKYPNGKQFTVTVSYHDFSDKKSYKDKPFTLDTKDYITSGSDPNIDYSEKLTKLMITFYEKELREK